MLRTLVTTTIVSTKARDRFVHFALDVDAASIEEVHKRLITDASIFGHRIVAEFDQNGRRIIVDRVPQIVGHHVVATITICKNEYFERDGAAANA